MVSSHLSIQVRVIRAVHWHCLQLLPKEGCGILAGQAPTITRFFPIPNRDNSNQTFSFDPRAYLDTIRKMRREGLDWLGIVHSHPDTEPYPSARDITHWHYPELSHWILSLRDRRPRLSAYYIQHGRVIPVMYQVLTDRDSTDRSRME
ncbi:Mov34/MPN/PAD-1 family protein [Paludifilum halophilum]|uniref:Mov34/MPN/PAD-1 family protein n=1 Tax=Paludifilum halophilum TaxID=1642702 RepID=UPI00146E0D8F|nr:M67 family metallopeptidase [Paludifilum halophilum]